MDALTRVIQQTEKPGRLQLAIVEWQRQLVAKREAHTVEQMRSKPQNVDCEMKRSAVPEPH